MFNRRGKARVLHQCLRESVLETGKSFIAHVLKFALQGGHMTEAHKHSGLTHDMTPASAFGAAVVVIAIVAGLMWAAWKLLQEVVPGAA